MPSDAHGAGVANLIGQACTWSNSRFVVKTNTVFVSEDGNNGSSPDLVVEVPVGQRAPGAGASRVCKFSVITASGTECFAF